MPKINVYLPEDLAAAVKRAGFPVSPVCQQALAEAVRTFAAARKAIEAIRSRNLDGAATAAAERGAEGRMTARLTSIIERAGVGRQPEGPVGTGLLMLGLLDEGANLAVGLIGALGVDIDDLRAAVDDACSAVAEEGGAGQGGGGAGTGASADGASWLAGLSWAARDAIASGIEAALDLGHNYVGTEHLLLGLLADPDSQAGRVLRAQGMDEDATRRALTGALAGYAQGRKAASGAATITTIDDFAGRLEAIERRLAALGA